MDTILLTGFEPFNGEAVNPSCEIARALDGAVLQGRRVVVRQLPCVFGLAGQKLVQAIRETAPVIVVAMGQAGSRTEVSLERVAINVDDAPIPDNAGQRPVDRAIEAAGPAAYFSSLPIKAMAAAMRRAGVPAGVSQTAGTYVCNHVFYALQHALRDSTVPSGFVHVPWLDEQAAQRPGAFGLPLEAMVRALRVGLETAARSLDGTLAEDTADDGGAIA